MSPPSAPRSRAQTGRERRIRVLIEATLRVEDDLRHCHILRRWARPFETTTPACELSLAGSRRAHSYHRRKCAATEDAACAGSGRQRREAHRPADAAADVAAGGRLSPLAPERSRCNLPKLARVRSPTPALPAPGAGEAICSSYVDGSLASGGGTPSSSRMRQIDLRRMLSEVIESVRHARAPGTLLIDLPCVASSPFASTGDSRATLSGIDDLGVYRKIGMSSIVGCCRSTLMRRLERAWREVRCRSCPTWIRASPMSPLRANTGRGRRSAAVAH